MSAPLQPETDREALAASIAARLGWQPGVYEAADDILAARQPAPTVSAEQVGHVLSERLDDDAPLNERRYIREAEHLAQRFPSLGIEVRDV